MDSTTNTREDLVRKILQTQEQLRHLLAKIDTVKSEHHKIHTENQVLEKYMDNLMSTKEMMEP
ncbi:hypothetical protein K493DRAFT_320677 [Basidiobolus meristosporus CBS 931.73]|uniref:Uncharacterized protein n=1 Tax=Basidiobolus meristosporus CBS 931.73 TaxID=1314790 RepID=A0A1Y1X6T3_9FUNG|nr:hypothetical protein K493DRAFT_320677 [Basidiobolus meristosporus CBS 931.73]|eukprot:ORX81412.1 hypothetical protein K493DRAFT_320677 [Basidiobolus meristosporus CBS 931.73]